jgi:signal transduction histidine kinase
MASPSRRARSIARPIFLLVLGAIVLATAITFAITYGGPPPRPAPIPPADIVQALQGIPARGLRAVPGLIEPRRREHRDPRFERSLTRELGGEVRGAFEAPRLGHLLEIWGSFTISWRPAGQAAWRTVRTPDGPLVTRWQMITFGSMALAFVLLSIPAWLIARTISGPLERLARSAGEARVGRPLALPEGGSREVRALGAALEAMHERIGRHAEGRTVMFAAIAHDLGTPLSRLAFHAEGLPEAQRVRAQADIEEMRALIAAALSFARDEVAHAPVVRIDLGALIDSLADDMRAAGDDVTLVAGPRAIVGGDPAALRRMFANLFGNAVRYGQRARVAWTVAGGRVTVTVDDDGPGIDPAEAERLFEPFVRGDPSRNRGTGGSGLGLAIVRTIAERHGGTATLGNREGGGARAVIVLAC